VGLPHAHTGLVGKALSSRMQRSPYAPPPASHHYFAPASSRATRAWFSFGSRDIIARSGGLGRYNGPLTACPHNCTALPSAPHRNASPRRLPRCLRTRRYLPIPCLQTFASTARYSDTKLALPHHPPPFMGTIPPCRRPLCPDYLPRVHCLLHPLPPTRLPPSLLLFHAYLSAHLFRILLWRCWAPCLWPRAAAASPPWRSHTLPPARWKKTRDGAGLAPRRHRGRHAWAGYSCLSRHCWDTPSSPRPT